ncbi:MAG: DNA polymerase I, partial [Clostridia bacterium]|nr:DNA polymerase I [Clostridia bacterium]
MEKFLIIDANSIINRAFYGIRLLTAKDGTYTNAVYGFLNIFYKFKEEIQPDYIAAAFDLKAPTFRHKMFDGYKATRKPMPEELVPQIGLMKEVLTALGIPVLEKEGYEADDIIGTVSEMCTQKGISCMILTGDKDDLQLATEHNKVYLVTTRMGNTSTEIFDAAHVLEKYGVTPTEFIDVKAIMGDTSDNIPGVRGIGEKGAFALIEKFKSLEAVYENIEDESIGKSIRSKLMEKKDTAFLSKTLATIDKHVPIDLDYEAARENEGDTDALRTLYTRLEFKSFLKRLPQSTEVTETSTQKQEVTGISANPDTLKGLLSSDKVFYQIEGESNTLYATLDGKTVYSAPISGEYLPICQAFFESENQEKISFGLKEQFLYLESRGISLCGKLFDAAIAAYLIDPSRR